MAPNNRGPVVVDTDVYSSRLLPNSALARASEPVLIGRVEFISFQTAAEVRFGALLRGWGKHRLERVDTELAKVEIVHSGPELVRIYADLRANCQRAGHALAQRDHDADRWIAATAIRLGIPLVSNDGIFRDAPGLVLEGL